jgi:hypothetical protein
VTGFLCLCLVVSLPIMAGYRGGRTFLIGVVSVFAGLCLLVALLTNDDSVRSVAYTLSCLIGFMVIVILCRRSSAAQLQKIFDSPPHNAVGWNIQSEKDRERAIRRVKVAAFDKLLRETDDTQPLWRARAKEGY